MDEPASLGAWIGRRRRALDLTQAELAAARRLRAGHASASSKRDERRPSKQIAARLADQLQLAPEAAGHLPARRPRWARLGTASRAGAGRSAGAGGCGHAAAQHASSRCRVAPTPLLGRDARGGGAGRPAAPPGRAPGDADRSRRRGQNAPGARGRGRAAGCLCRWHRLRQSGPASAMRSWSHRRSRRRSACGSCSGRSVAGRASRRTCATSRRCCCWTTASTCSTRRPSWPRCWRGARREAAGHQPGGAEAAGRTGRTRCRRWRCRRSRSHAAAGAAGTVASGAACRLPPRRR